MSTTTEQAQLIITIDAKESVKFRDILQGNKEAIKDLKDLKAGQEGFNQAIQRQIEISRKLQSVDFSKVSIGQLRERRKELATLQTKLTAAEFAEAGFANELKMVNEQMAVSAGRTRKLTTETSVGFSRARLAAAAAVATVGAFIAQIGGAAAKYEKYNAMLKVALGSQQAADDAMNLVKETAEDTVFTVDELTNSYTKLANRGIKLTKSEIISLSDLAASQGKSFEQLTEALLDAQTGEFERLKEFGIRGSKAGDQARLSFKNFNDTVALTPDGIKNAMIEMGRMQGVAGSNEEMMSKLTGKWSNFMDVIDNLKAVVGGALSGVFGRFVDLASNVGKAITEWISPTVTAREETIKLQKEFNTEIGVLKRLRPEAQGRKELIEQINQKYKDYLPNLIKESDGIREIEAAQKAANVAFQEKLIYLAFEEEYKAQLDKTKKAVKELAAVEMSRARSAQSNEEFAGMGASPAQIEMQRKASANFINSVEKNAQSVVDNNEKVVADMEASYDKVAKKIGSSLDRIRAKYAQTAPVEVEVKDKATGDGKKKEKKLSFEVDFTQAKADENFQQNLDRELANIEEGSKRRQLLLETKRNEEKVTEEAHNMAMLQEKARLYEEQLDLMASFGLQESTQYMELRNLQLQNEKEMRESRMEDMLGENQFLLDALQRQFLNGLLTEEEYNIKRLEAQSRFYEEKLRLMEAQGLAETDVFRRLEMDKLQIDSEIKKQLLENEKRHNEIKKSLQDAGYQAFSDSIDAAISAMGRDEKARKKNAGYIKAFEKAKVVVNTQREISEIWKNANSSPANILFPGYAQLIAGIQTALAIGRGAVAISTIDSQQFRRGGLTGFAGAMLQGPSHEYGGIKTPFGEMEGGEAVINKRSTRLFGPLLSAINSFNGFGKKFALGGLVGSTTPIGLQGVNIGASSGIGMDPAVMTEWTKAMQVFTSVMPMALSNIKATISYESKVESEKTMEQIQKLASI